MKKEPVLVPSFWFMKDDHTFIKPRGNNLEEIKNDLLRIAKKNPYGMICSVIIMEDYVKELRRVGKNAHVNEHGNVDLSEWYREVSKDDVINNYQLPMEDKLKVKFKGPGQMPVYAKKGDAGCDLYYNGLPTVINPGESILLFTGIYLEIPEGYEAQVRPRSGLALEHGITVLNTPGTIDEGFRGEVGVILINHSKKPFIVKYADKIAQLVFNKVEHAKFIRVDELSSSDRGEGGFGHTGIH